MLMKKRFIAFYLAHHHDKVPCSRSAIHPNWMDLHRRLQGPHGVLLSEHGHTGEQAGCRAEQGELDLHGHRLSVQPAAWLEELQFGSSIKPAGEQKTVEEWWVYCTLGSGGGGVDVSYFLKPRLIGPVVQPRWPHVPGDMVTGPKTLDRWWVDVLFLDKNKRSLSGTRVTPETWEFNQK